MQYTPKNILLLCAESARHTGTVDLHIKAFKEYSRHHVVTMDSHFAGLAGLDLDMFDAVIFHYSIIISLPQYISDTLSKKISAFSGLKILFIQDEFRWVDRTSRAAEKLGISVVFTVVNEDVIRKIYRDKYFDKVRFEQTLTGFIPEELLNRKVPDYMDRSLDIGYRARKLPGWCGSFALQKWHIGKKILECAPTYKLKCDIAMSEESRIYGENWIQFISSCRATLGTESGASFVDYSGLVHQEIDKYEAANPEAPFVEIKDKFLEGRDNEVVIHVISPRIFEAAALRVLMILYPGTYSDVIKPGRHYVELQPDHSNIDEVIAILRDPDRAGEIINNAYEEVACSPTWTHKSFIEHFDNVCEEEFQKYSTKVGALRNRFKNDRTAKVEKMVARQIAEFERLEAANAKFQLHEQKRMNSIFQLQKIKVALFEFIDTKLPKILSRPLLSIARFIVHRTKPMLKKLLLKG